MTDLPRNAEDLTDEQVMELFGVADNGSYREWLGWLMENEMIDVSNLIDSLIAYMGENGLKRCLEVNELSPTRYISEECLQDMLDERDADTVAVSC